MAVRVVFNQYFEVTEYETEIEVLGAYGVEVSDELSADAYQGLCRKVKYLNGMVKKLMKELEPFGRSPQHVASAVEFLLEGLHVNKKLNKNEIHGKAVYEL